MPGPGTDEDESKEKSSSDTKKNSSDDRSKRSSSDARGLPLTSNLEDMKIEQLFSLEVLVNSIEVLKEPIHLKTTADEELPPMHVRIKFIDFPCIEICQDDFLDSKMNLTEGKDVQSEQTDTTETDKIPKITQIPTTNHTQRASKKADDDKEKSSLLKQNVALSSGKSCLFPMSPLQLLREIQRHSLVLNVYREFMQTKESTETKKHTVGQCRVKLGQEFEDAIMRAVHENLPLPTTTSIENVCELKNLLGDVTGSISIFVRLSCFGATIVTDFKLLGEESEGYIFKTSRKDNTTEAQKKKCHLVANKISPKKEPVVKSAYIHDISPLLPIITTEENALHITGGVNNHYLSSPYKLIPWRKYVTECTCENTEDVSEIDQPVPFGCCGCSQKKNLPPRTNQTQASNFTPCPLPDCDCYNTATFDLNRRPASSIQSKLEEKSETGCCVGEDGKTCTDCDGSSTITQQSPSNKANLNNSCPVEDCDCLRSPSKTPNLYHQTRQTDEDHRNFCPCQKSDEHKTKRCTADDCECFNSIERKNFIRKKSPPVSRPYDSIYSPYQTINSPTGDGKVRSNEHHSQQNSKIDRQMWCPVDECECNINSKAKKSKDGSIRQQYSQSVNNSQRQSRQNQYCQNNASNNNSASNEYPGEDNYNFSDSQAKNYVSSQSQSSQNRSDAMKCKIGYNHRNECFCYGGGTTRPYSDTFGSQYPKSTMAAKGWEFKSSYEAGSGVLPSTQAGNMPTQTDEFLQTGVEEEKTNQKLDETGAGGDTNWADAISDKKLSTAEKVEDWAKQVIQTEEKKPEELQDGYRDLDTEQARKVSNMDDKATLKRISDSKKLQKKKKFNAIYDYATGMYPGINIGHQHCISNIRFVPKTMGWLWNLGDLGDNLRPRRGWRPGAITRSINKMIREGKVAAGLLVEEESEEKKTVKGVKKGRRPYTARGGTTPSNTTSGEFYNAVPQPPTLHLHKKDGAYFISMNPLKADSEDEDEDRTPIMFKILPHEDELSTSSESSIEIEFTAPGAFRRKPIKPVMETVDTQYSDPESIVEIQPPPTPKGKKGTPAASVDTKGGPRSSPPSTMASVAKDNKWDADQPTQVGKAKPKK